MDPATAAVLIDGFIVIGMRSLEIAGKLNKGEDLTDEDLALKETFDQAVARIKQEKGGK